VGWPLEGLVYKEAASAMSSAAAASAATFPAFCGCLAAAAAAAAAAASSSFLASAKMLHVAGATRTFGHESASIMQKQQQLEQRAIFGHFRVSTCHTQLLLLPLPRLLRGNRWLWLSYFPASFPLGNFSVRRPMHFQYTVDNVDNLFVLGP